MIEIVKHEIHVDDQDNASNVEDIKTDDLMQIMGFNNLKTEPAKVDLIRINDDSQELQVSNIDLVISTGHWVDYITVSDVVDAYANSLPLRDLDTNKSRSNTITNVPPATRRRSRKQLDSGKVYINSKSKYTPKVKVSKNTVIAIYNHFRFNTEHKFKTWIPVTTLLKGLCNMKSVVKFCKEKQICLPVPEKRCRAMYVEALDEFQKKLNCKIFVFNRKTGLKLSKVSNVFRFLSEELPIIDDDIIIE